MNRPIDIETYGSACPHDCPSTCALDVELLPDGKIGRIRGSRDNDYTDGIICSKVSRYSERLYHPDRLTKPRIRDGDDWRDISWTSALDLIAEQFLLSEQRYGSESVWPYYYAGTMGLVQRDSIHRLRHAKRYSHQLDTICITNSWTGFSAATGRLLGPDPREMSRSDCVVIWGTNVVSTQVNVMRHAVRARKERGAKIVAIDIYENETMRQADMALLLRPGTDAALACSVMHVLFRDGYADWDYLRTYTDCPDEFAEHLRPKTPEWGSSVTGLSIDKIESFARLVGERKRSYFRLGYGFTRSRNGSVSMHAACCVPTVTGAWREEGGGAFHINSDIYNLDTSFLRGESYRDSSIRTLDQSQIGRVLTNDVDALGGGVPVTSMLIQNTNPVSVAPEQGLVKRGFARDDLFVAVHEQFMTETAELSDVVLPATMFVEHDDIYRGGGHQYIIYGPKLVDAPIECRSNLYVIDELASRLGVSDLPGFGLDATAHIDKILVSSSRGTLSDLRSSRWLDCQPSFRESHYLDGFGHPDKKFHFRADWLSVPWGRPPPDVGLRGSYKEMPSFPDYWSVTESVTDDYPLRLATSPSRSFLNSTFTEMDSSISREGIIPYVLVHPETAVEYGVSDGCRVCLSNSRGSVILVARFFVGILPGVLVAEGIYPNSLHEGGCGINTLVGADSTAPHGGTAFHDIAVSLIPL